MRTNSYGKARVSELMQGQRLSRRIIGRSSLSRADEYPAQSNEKLRAARPVSARRNGWRGRGKSAPFQVLSWAEAEAALARLAGLERELGEIDSEEREAMARAQSEADARRSHPARQRETLAAALERFSRKELAPRGDLSSVQVPRSRRLRIGRLGYRQAHAVVIRNEATALRSLAASPQGRRYLRVTEAVDREGLRGFLMNHSAGRTSARLKRRLQRAGVRLVRRDYWFYEVNGETPGHWGASA
ncbi:MAG: host-nuclease inhibitor Gam family protein [Candidatus Acidiferrales bacterium]